MIHIFNTILNKFGYKFQNINEAYLPWPTCFHAVDIAVYDIYSDKILLGRKSGKDYWVFPGGFTDPISKNDEEDAVRELFEETDIVKPSSSLVYIGNYFIDDLRYINSKNKIRTHFYRVDCSISEKVKAKDDLEEVKWFDVKYLIENINTISPRHQHLFHEFLKSTGY